jgi:hypothetical protein
MASIYVIINMGGISLGKMALKSTILFIWLKLDLSFLYVIYNLQG